MPVRTYANRAPGDERVRRAACRTSRSSTSRWRMSRKAALSCAGSWRALVGGSCRSSFLTAPRQRARCGVGTAPRARTTSSPRNLSLPQPDCAGECAVPPCRCAGASPNTRASLRAPPRRTSRSMPSAWQAQWGRPGSAAVAHRILDRARASPPPHPRGNVRQPPAAHGRRERRAR